MNQTLKSHLIFSLKVIFSFVLLNSCRTLPPKEDLNSTALQISSTFYFKNQKEQLTLYAYLKNEDLRIDILKSFFGYVAHVYLKKKQMVVYLPSKMSYYKGQFESQIFLPMWDSLSYQLLLAILKGPIPEKWSCNHQKQPPCSTESLKKTQFSLFKKQELIREVELKISKDRRATLRIKKLSNRNLQNTIFDFQAGQRKRLNRLQFQKLLQML